MVAARSSGRNAIAVALGPVIAAYVLVDLRRAAKLAHPHHQRLIRKSEVEVSSSVLTSSSSVVTTDSAVFDMLSISRRLTQSTGRRILNVYTIGVVMITKIQKWGNSLGVRIPKSVAQDVQVQDGTVVDLRIDKGRLVIVPIQKNAYDLSEMLEQVTPENLHAEVDFGEPIGGEAW